MHLIPLRRSIMPSIAEVVVSPSNCKKRRREDHAGVNDEVTKLSRYLDSIVDGTASAALTNVHSSLHTYDEPLRLIFNHDLDSDIYQRQTFSHRRRLLDAKRQRISPADWPVLDSSLGCDSSTEWTADRHLGETAIEVEYKAAGLHKVDLSQCHICHRKPTAKNELAFFGDCDCCEERTCWICMRQCLGMGAMQLASTRAVALGSKFSETAKCNSRYQPGHEVEVEMGMHPTRLSKDRRLRGHRDRICSRCCVERGTEGEVWCSGCLRAEEAD